YRALNRVDPDCGTTFAWVTRAIGPRAGWVTGFAIFAADVIVMATLSEIAGKYFFRLVGWDSAASSTVGLALAAVFFIAVMTWVTIAAWSSARGCNKRCWESRSSCSRRSRSWHW